MRTWSALSKEASKFEQATKSTSKWLIQTSYTYKIYVYINVHIVHEMFASCCFQTQNLMLRVLKLPSVAAESTVAADQFTWHCFKYWQPGLLSNPEMSVFKCCLFHIVFMSDRDCQNVLNVTQDLAGQSDSFRQFEGGVKLGIGSFNLVGF